MLPDSYGDWIQFYGAFLGLLAFILACMQAKASEPRLTGNAFFSYATIGIRQYQKMYDLTIAAKLYAHNGPVCITQYEAMVDGRKVEIGVSLATQNDLGYFTSGQYRSGTIEDGRIMIVAFEIAVPVDRLPRKLQFLVSYAQNSKPLVLKVVGISQKAIDAVMPKESLPRPMTGEAG